MRKTPSLFVRDFAGDPSLALPEITPGCEWVVNDEGIATLKIDGSACLWRDGRLFGRYDAKHGKTPPASFVPAQPEPDAITNHWPGWVPIEETGFKKQAAEALATDGASMHDGWTYELVGPKMQGNPHGHDAHRLIRHGSDYMTTAMAPRTFDGLREWFAGHVVEGIVWWRDLKDAHCDKVKIKRRDFGLPWPEGGK